MISQAGVGLVEAPVAFAAEAAPGEELLARVAALAPTNPFYAPAYLRSRVELGARPVVLGLRRGDDWLTACPALLRAGRWSRTLEIESLPALPAGSAFWDGLLRFCRQSRVTDLKVNTFGSPLGDVPPLPGETSRTSRREYVLTLSNRDLWAALPEHHRRHIKRARKAGLRVRVTTDPAALAGHEGLVSQSLQRHRERGEAVPEGSMAGEWEVLLRCGAGRLFQALAGEQLLSSMLVITAERGAYSHSSGTGPEGRGVGSSHFLLHEMALSLQAEGFELLNLGGADEKSPGLHKFKADFGTVAVPLEAVECLLGGALWRKARTVLRLLRNNPGGLLGAVTRLDRLLVFSADPREAPPPEPVEGAEFVKLSDEALLALPWEFHEQVERFRRLGYNAAYAVTKGGQVAHVSWLVLPEHDGRNRIRNVKLRPGEAEINHCLTAAQFRGQGLYPFAVRSLCRIAAEQGVRRVFMCTNPTNASSIRGIEKAGLRRCGTVYRVVFPFVPRHQGVPLRTHRWRT